MYPLKKLDILAQQVQYYFIGLSLKTHIFLLALDFSHRISFVTNIYIERKRGCEESNNIIHLLSIILF